VVIGFFSPLPVQYLDPLVLGVDAGYLVLSQGIDVALFLEEFRGIDDELVKVFDYITDVIGKPSEDEGDEFPPFKGNDLPIALEAPRSGGGGHPRRPAADDDELLRHFSLLYLAWL